METIEIIIGHNNLEWLDDAIRNAMKEHGYEYICNDCLMEINGVPVFRMTYGKINN